MNTENICKALYALPGGVVTPKRESIATQIIVALVGVAILVVNSLLVDDSAEVMSMALLTIGVGMILYGIVVAVVRRSGQREVPYDNEARSYMRYRERYYDRELVAPIRSALERGDFEAIALMPTTNVAAIILVEYCSKLRKAYALYEYSESEYRPIGTPKIENRA
jgi:hypothetical protein